MLPAPMESLKGPFETIGADGGETSNSDAVCAEADCTGRAEAI
jgi:hypothetical protein